jgi:hypothetical protein
VDGRLIPYPAGLYLTGLFAASLLGNLRDVVLARVGLAVVLGSMATIILNRPGHAPGELVFIPLLFGIAWLAGFALNARAEQADAAEARAAQAEREREAAARVAVAEERTRIARELHDIVAHAVSVMVLQVGAVRHRLPTSSTTSPTHSVAWSRQPDALTEMPAPVGDAPRRRRYRLVPQRPRRRGLSSRIKPRRPPLSASRARRSAPLRSTSRAASCGPHQRAQACRRLAPT